VSRLGVLGGTFDPIHLGHLDVARAAQHLLGLDRILVVPSHTPPHRAAPRASAAHRFAMAALAVQDDAALIVSDVEMRGQGPSFTAATLERLRAEGVDLPSVVFITGADAFADIETWKDFPALLDRCHFAAVSRPGVPAGSLRGRLPALAARMIDAPCTLAAIPSIVLVDSPTAAVSSTEVRRRVGAGESIHGLVPDAVADHISKHGLYGPQGVA
jgi:nicotinate-nucleotide adenylyltransferase